MSNPNTPTPTSLPLLPPSPTPPPRRRSPNRTYTAPPFPGRFYRPMSPSDTTTRPICYSPRPNQLRRTAGRADPDNDNDWTTIYSDTNTILSSSTAPLVPSVYERNIRTACGPLDIISERSVSARPSVDGDLRGGVRGHGGAGDSAEGLVLRGGQLSGDGSGRRESLESLESLGAEEKIVVGVEERQKKGWKGSLKRGFRRAVVCDGEK